MTRGAGGSAGTTTNDAGAASGPLYLGLSPLAPGEGFQVRTIGADVPVGQEIEYCEVAQLPGNPGELYWVNDIELGNGQGSHHLLMSAAIPGSPAEQKIKELKIGDHVSCISAQVAFGEVGLPTEAGVQTRHDRFKMPKGVGAKYYGGQYLIFDYHFLNTSSDTIHALSAANLRITDAASITHEAAQFEWANYTINTPAHSSQAFTAECHMKKDVMVATLLRHTHKLGTNFDVWFAGGAHDGEHIWTSTDWESETQFTFPEPLLVKAGEGFRFQCGFTNPGTKALRFGTSTADEMCILFGAMWEAQSGGGLDGNTECDVIWNDAKGIGHPADEAGGVPKPDLVSSLSCSLLAGSDTDCKKCLCSECGTPALACAADTDCVAGLTCFASCATGEDCAAKCEPTLQQHPSAIGLLQQAKFCLKANCSACPVQ
jgi:hypothetical protein